MDITDIITIFAILIECAIAVIAILTAIQNKKIYGWCIAITFALFALFDVVRILSPYGLSGFHSLILLVASISMLYAMWLMYNDVKKSS